MTESAWHWLRTIGAPRPGDKRDGELHQHWGELPDTTSLEPWDDDPDGQWATYDRDPGPPEMNDDGRPVWRYVYRDEAADDRC